MSDEKLNPDFADLPLQDRADIEGLAGIGLHHAPAVDAQVSDAPAGDAVTGDAFHHPERDEAGTVWAPNWEPIDTYTDGDVVMLDDGNRQILGLRDMGMWMELADGDQRPQPDYLPMLWSRAPDQVKYDML